MAQKKVVMNHALAKALMDAGMEHFDAGGSPTSTVGDSNIGTSYLPGNSVTGMNVDGNFIPGPGGIIQGVAEGMTPQNTFQAQLAPIKTYDYTNPINIAMAGVEGGAPQNQNILAQQQGLANQLNLQAQGGGPNPALTQLNQTTGTNTANQAALMAGQRGASGNAGLMARQIAQMGAANQQNAVGTAATQRAQQQLNAQQALSNQQAQMQQANLGEQSAQNTYLGTLAGAHTAQNAALVNNYGQAQGMNQKTASENAAANQKTAGSLMDSIGSVAAMLYKGGEVKPEHQHLHEIAKIYHPDQLKFKNFTQGGEVPGKPLVNKNSPKNDVVPALLSSKEAVLPLSVTQSKNPPEKAKEFMEHLASHSSEKEQGEKQKNDLHRALKKNKGTIKDRLNRLEKLCYGGMS